MIKLGGNRLWLLAKSVAAILFLFAIFYRVADSEGPAVDSSTPITQAMTLTPRAVPMKPASVAIHAESYNGHVVLKLREGLDTELSGRRLADARRGDLAAVNQILSQPSVSSAKRLFSRSKADLRAERQAAEIKSRRQLADLCLYYHLAVADAVDAEQVINQ